jgi:hypothetical protein
MIIFFLKYFMSACWIFVIQQLKLVMGMTKSFIWRKQVLEDQSLHSTTKLVAMMLHYHMDNHTCECFPSEATIAQEASLTERCVVNHIKKLSQKLYISIRKEKGGQGWNRNCYRGILHPEYHSESIKEEGEFETIGGEYKDQKIVNEIQSNSSNNSPNNSTELDNFFNQFWEIYPELNRYNKSKCIQLWKSRNLENLGKTIVDVLKLAKKSESWTQGYIPSSFKFLDEEHWQRKYRLHSIYRGVIL